MVSYARAFYGVIKPFGNILKAHGNQENGKRKQHFDTVEISLWLQHDTMDLSGEKNRRWDIKYKSIEFGEKYWTKKN